MAVRRILREDDDKLRKKAHAVGKIDRRLLALLKDMAETMYAAEGCGLAAPQVGIMRRAVVIDVGEGLIELINPVIIDASGMQSGPEGCLSIPGKKGLVERPEKVSCTAINRNGEAFEFTAEGFFARAVCHELDHLEGQLYTDIMLEEIHDADETEEAAHS